jgi:hypothetical protein
MEYLVTAQAYEKTDRYKQTFLLHDTFLAKDESGARNAFMDKFQPTHNIVKIFSAIGLDNNT